MRCLKWADSIADRCKEATCKYLCSCYICGFEIILMKFTPSCLASLLLITLLFSQCGIRRMKQDANTRYYFYLVNNKTQVVSSWVNEDANVVSRISCYSTDRHNPDSIILYTGQQVFMGLTDTNKQLSFFGRSISYPKKGLRVPTVKHQQALRGMRIMDPFTKYPKGKYAFEEVIAWMPIRTMTANVQPALKGKKPF
jgi:hypothetical protein